MAENVFFSLNVVPFTVTLQFSCRLFNKSTLIINYNLFNKYRQNACNNGTGGAERGWAGPGWGSHDSRGAPQPGGEHREPRGW